MVIDEWSPCPYLNPETPSVLSAPLLPLRRGNESSYGAVQLPIEVKPPQSFLAPNCGLEEFKIRAIIGRESGQNMDWTLLECDNRGERGGVMWERDEGGACINCPPLSVLWWWCVDFWCGKFSVDVDGVCEGCVMNARNVYFNYLLKYAFQRGEGWNSPKQWTLKFAKKELVSFHRSHL